MLKKILMTGFALLSIAGVAQAESKIGFITIQRILAESPQAARATKKIEKDFEKRDQELQRMAKQLQTAQATLDKNSTTMAESERRNKEREVADLTRDIQRKQREFSEDLSQRRNEELASIFERVNKAIKQIAEAEKYDVILQEAVYFNPRLDITDKVIKALGDGTK